MIGELNIFDDPESLAKGLTTFLIGNIREASGSSLNLALSGGNTPSILFRNIALEYGSKVDWNTVNFYWADERCVAPNDSQSNYLMAKQNLFDRIEIEKANIHRIRGEDEPAEEAERYSSLVYSNLPIENNIPQFDIILLGMGSDGHIASIFPDQMQLIDSELIYTTAVHPETGQMRITMTGTAINNAKCVIFLVSGKEKAGVLSAVLSEEPAYIYPASFVSPLSGNLFWFLDKQASSLVRR